MFEDRILATVARYVKFEIKAELCDEDVDDWASEWSDQEAADAWAAEIGERLWAGDVWAWAYVTVTARIGAFSYDAVMSGISYKDREDFVNSDTYKDLAAEAFHNLMYEISQTGE